MRNLGPREKSEYVLRKYRCNRHTEEGGRRVDFHLSQVLEIVEVFEIERTRDVIQVNCDGEDGIVLLLTPEALEIRFGLTEWSGQRPRRSSLLSKRVEWRELEGPRLWELILGAIEARRADFYKCAYCGDDFRLEYMTEGACHGCAQTHRGIVY